MQILSAKGRKIGHLMIVMREIEANEVGDVTITIGATRILAIDNGDALSSFG